jgi:hypothetical protein
VGLNVHAVVIDGYVILEMERALNQHKFSSPAIGAGDESQQCKRHELVDRYCERL